MEFQELDGTKRHLVAISDVHLGTDRPTVWYQRDLHEPYLTALLHWVIDQADHIAELVLLGDIVDFWTYPAGERPPTFAEIAATHPALFGADGLFAKALEALDGRVTYIPGNHDQGITATEVASITGPGPHHIQLHEAVPYRPTGPEGPLPIALTHGHHFTLFNAPAAEGPHAPLPIGYFVTRAVATKWARDLAPGDTVADLADQGAPNGLDLSALVRSIGGVASRSVAASLVDFVSAATGVSLDEPMVMPDGTTATLGDARGAHADCWTRWSNEHGGGSVGLASAARAALADFDGSCLGWFAQRLGLEHDCDLVVMGHTHVPVRGLDAAMVDYVNTGFDCPSAPDLQRAEGPAQVTFAVVDTQEIGAEVWAVTDGGRSIGPVEAATDRITLRPGSDFSCYVVVDNQHGTTDLELVEHGAANGAYVVPPPPLVPAGKMGRFWLQDLVGVSGSSGSATYRHLGGGDPLVLSFACPTMGVNACSGTDTYATAVGADGWTEGRTARWGHPFFVTFEAD